MVEIEGISGIILNLWEVTFISKEKGPLHNICNFTEQKAEEVIETHFMFQLYPIVDLGLPLSPAIMH